MTKTLTIITVTKNCIKTISRTLDSIKKIKNEAIEYIVVDGMSDDGTQEVLNKNKNFIDKLITEKDTGIYNAMNKGAFLAEGKYILFLNGDDEIVSEKFEKVIDYLTKKKPSILCCKTKAYNMNGEFNTLVAKPIRLLFYNSIPHPSTFVATNLQKKFKFREDLKIASDYDFFLRMYIGFIKFEFLDYCTAVHYPGGKSSNVRLSELEISLIRRERLGYFVLLLNVCNNLRKIFKKLTIGNRSSDHIKLDRINFD